MEEWIHNESKQNKFTNQVVFPGLSRNYYFLGFLPSEFEKRNLTDVEFKTAGKKS